MNGVLVLDKPAGMSSAAAVDSVKKQLRAKRAGHGGTLDPIATGVLAICLDEATKIAQYLLADNKAYLAELVLGRTTDTLDRTGVVQEERDASGVTSEQIERVLAAHMGEQDQVPPMYSAIKQDGVRLYKQARRGVEVERQPRKIRIDRLNLVAYAGDRITIDVACSKGTYIRSLVDDIGRELGCGAYLAELRRTESGTFSIADAQLITALDPTRLVSIERVLTLPKVTATPEQVPYVRSGLQLKVDQMPDVPAEPVQFQIIDEAARVVAIAHAEAGKILYDRVFVG